MGMGFLFGVMKLFEGREREWLHNILNVLNIPQLYSKMVNFMLPVFYLEKKKKLRTYTKKVIYNLLIFFLNHEV